MFPIQFPNVRPGESSSCENQLSQEAFWMISGRMRRVEASLKLNRTDFKWTKTEPLNTQRWKNEGGRMIADKAAILNQSFAPLVPMDARTPVTSLQWSERFVIEPLQQGTGILREEMTGKGQHSE